MTQFGQNRCEFASKNQFNYQHLNLQSQWKILWKRRCVKIKMWLHGDFRLVLLQVPTCFVPVQFFWASPKIWLHLLPIQILLCRHKNEFYWIQIIFLSDTKCLWLPQYLDKFLVWHKKFGPALNILGPVKGQGIHVFTNSVFHTDYLPQSQACAIRDFFLWF